MHTIYTHTQATPLPDDPAVQQLIAKLRVAEMKLEAKEERIKDLEKLVETKDELLASKDNLLASQDELRKVERRDNARLNAQVLAFERKCLCLSPLAPRLAVRERACCHNGAVC
jgi:hypothetical protein